MGLGISPRFVVGEAQSDFVMNSRRHIIRGVDYWVNLANNFFASSCDSRCPARLFFRPKCDVTVSNWSDEREGQNGLRPVPKTPS